MSDIIESSVATKVLVQRVHAALNRVETWNEHPTFDTKPEVLSHARGVRHAAEVLNEITTGKMILESWSFGVPWLLYSDLITSIMHGTKEQRRRAISRVRTGIRDGITPE